MVRKKQRGIACSVEGCNNWCVSNDLCAKHSMRERRKQEKYKAYIRKYNKNYKRPDIQKSCILCGVEFTTARINQGLCSDCSGSNKGNYLAQKRHRAKYKIK